MKKILLSSALFLISFIGFSQTKGISYQAVIIDPNPIEIPGKDITAQPYVSKDVWIRFGIYAGSTLQYEELHKTKTDEYGLVNLVIGAGVNTGKAGTFTSLSWDGVTKNMITSVSFDQGGRYTDVSNQKFTYVPYTFLAETAVKLAGVLPIASGGTGATNAIAARTNLGLGNVDNTADADKPVSIATLAIIDTKEAIANKSTNIIADSASSVKYPSVKAIKEYVDSRTANTNLANQANNANLAAKATALETPRTINGVAFDGTANITIPVGVTPADADSTTKGILQLAGDLSGTAASPRIKDGAITNAKITSVAGSKVTGDIAGNAATATLASSSTKLATARTINGIAFDGTADITIPVGVTPVDANATTKGILQLAGDLSGTAALPRIAQNAVTTTKLADGSVTDAKINTVSGSKVTGDIAGNAATATKLTTARTINGTAFDGTADITITTNASTLSGTIGLVNGGTGASTAAAARTNLGLEIGTDVLAQRTFGTAANSAATDFVAATEKGANNGVATLGNNGKIPSIQIPAISFQNVNVVNSDATMTAIAGAQVGSIAIRTDNNNNYVLSALPASNLANWIALATPLYVSTVNGYAGPNVVLTTNDVAEGTTNKYFTDARVRNAISAVAPLNFNATSGVLSMTAASTTSNGYLSSADFNTFNNKQTALTAGVDYATPSGNITGNAANVTGIVSIANGGTGTSTATGALAALGAEPSDNKSNNILLDGSSTTKFPTFKAIKDYVDQQSANAGVADNSITSAKINGTLAVLKGGTGASNPADARTNLGLVIGTDVMAANFTTTLTGDVTGSGNGSFATTVNSVGGVSSSTIATLPGLITTNTNAIAANTTSITSNSTDIATINTNLALKAPLASPAFTGTPTAPTPATSDNSTKVATTEYVKNSIVAANAGLSSIGAISATSNAKGATISGTTELILTPADITNGGVVTTGAQTFAGAKTFSNTANFLTDITVNGLTVGKGGGNISSNTAIGFSALALNTTGSGSTAFGNKALSKSTGGTATAFGSSALENLTIGTGNVAIGYTALNQTTSQNSNTAVGDQAMRFSTGSSNTVLGASALLGVSGQTNGINNTAIGALALRNATTAAFNVGVGSNSLNNLTAGNDNTVLGFLSGFYVGSGNSTNLTSLSQSVLIGSNVRAGSNASTNEVAIGYNVVGNGSNTVTIGNYSNTANYFRGDINLTGNVNGGTWSGTTIGSNYGGAGTVNGIMKADGAGVVTAIDPAPSTGQFLTSAAGGTYTWTAASSVTGVPYTGATQAVDLGAYDLKVNGLTIGRGKLSEISNTGVGIEVLNSVNNSSGGTALTAVGYRALKFNTSGNQNSAFGYMSLYFNNTGGANSSLGSYSLFSNTTGGNNSAFGAQSLYSNSTGQLNSALGSLALYNNNYGSRNTAIGYKSLYSTASSSSAGTDGNYNTALGFMSGNANTTGSNNTFLGYSADAATASLTNATAIGNGAIVNASNTVQIGNYSVTSVVTSGTISATGFTGPLTGNASTATALATGRSISTTGDISFTSGAFDGTTDLTASATLTNTSVTAGTYGSSTAIPTFTVDSKGRLTAASTVGITAGVSALSYTSTTSYANGGTISGTTLTLSAADGSNPGIISIGAQTIAGAKTFNNDVTAPTFIGNVTGTVTGNLTGTATTATNLAGGVSGSIPYQTAAGTTAMIPVGSANQFLTSTGSGTYTWTSTSAVTGNNVPYTGASGAVNLGAYDLTVNGLTVGKGGGASTNNTALGVQSLLVNTSGNSNTSMGHSALKANTTGAWNTAIGNNALAANTGGHYNTGLGMGTLDFLTSGSDNIALGSSAGRSSGAGNLTTSNQSIYIGNGSKSKANSSTNEIVIGHSTTGNGNNTVTIGNSSTTANYFTGSINLTGNVNGGTWSGTTIGSDYGGAGTVNGLLKANGSGVVSAAVAGTDYQAPLTSTQVGVLSNTSGTNTGDQTITLTGDVTGTGTGSFAATLSNTTVTAGAYGSSTTIPTFTVDSKGRLTAANTASIVADAGTLTGTSLASTVTGSSLTSVGTITSGVWSGTAIDIAKGGTGATTKSAAFDALSPMTTSGDIIYGSTSGTGTRLAKGTDGQVLTLASGIPAWSTISAVTSLGTFTTTTTYANGGTISGSTLTLGAADGTNPGLVSTGAQTFAGAKTFSTTTITSGSGSSYSALSPAIGMKVIPSLKSGGMYTDLVGVDIIPTFNTNGYDNTASQTGLRVQGANIVATGSGNDLTNTAIGNNSLKSNTVSSNGSNVAVGYNALTSTLTGTSNLAIGVSALQNLTNGASNIAIGKNALILNNASNNIAIGESALSNANGATYNIAIGVSSGVRYGAGGSYNYSAASGSKNILIGADTRLLNNTDSYEIVIGSSSGVYGIIGDGTNTTTIGTPSTTSTKLYGDILKNADTQNSSGAGKSFTIKAQDASLNTYTNGGDIILTPGSSGGRSGYNTGKVTFNGVLNMVAGTATSTTNGLSTYITAENAGAGNQNGGNINLTPGLATGTGSAGKVIVNGGDMTVNGLTVGRGGNGVSVTNANTTFGINALSSSSTSGSGANTAIGNSVLSANTSGSKNTGLGFFALNANVTGTDNTAVGYYALRANNSSSSDNTAIGSNAMYSNTSGTENTAVGSGSLNKNTSGNQNSVLGRYAYFNGEGSYNTAVGYRALMSPNAAGNTGEFNVSMGYYSGYSLTTGSQNVFLGPHAGFNNTTGEKNIMLGSNAGYYFSNSTDGTNGINSTGNGSVFIGYDVRPKANNETNQIVISGYTGSGIGAIGQGTGTTTIGNSSTTRAVIYGSTSLSNLPVTATSGNGGNFTLEAQDGFTTGNTNGGNIILTPGAANGTGTAGLVRVTSQIEIDGGSPGAGKVLTSDANGVATWQNSGGSIATMSATGTATSTATYIIFTGSTASQTITIPSAVTLGAGREITIKNVASVTVTIASAGGKLIQDSTTLTATSADLGIEPSNNWMKLVSDGTNWYIMRALF